jgi:signal transduction histidine kinase
MAEPDRTRPMTTATTQTRLGGASAGAVRIGGRVLTLTPAVTVAVVCAAAVTVVWAATGAGTFWPMWVWFGLALPLVAEATLREAWAQPRGDRRRLAVHGTLSALLVGAEVLIWLMAGMGFFWPVFPVVGLAVVFTLHLTLASRGDGELSARVDELTRTRRGALDVQAAELRRIERDLHDGAQSRLVALSLALGRAEARLEDRPEEAALIRQARDEATAAVAELRDLARGIAPPVLADRGLVAAVQGLASRSGAVVAIQAHLPHRPPPVVETAAYFVCAESLTNAVKHAPGAALTIVIAAPRDDLVVEITDDGPGGADPRSGGLTGLRQRVEALDGRLEVESAPGAGTTIRAVLPCVS